MAFKDIFVVDEDDKPVGLVPKKEVWAKGLLHRIVMIVVEDGQGRILLQKRSPTVDLFPGAWDYSAAGHVDEGETYEQAARRETEEEIGLRNPQLQEVARWHGRETFQNRILNRFNRLYRVHLNTAEFTPQPSEVSEVRWFTLSEIQKLIESHPDQLTPGLVKVMQKHYLGKA